MAWWRLPAPAMQKRRRRRRRRRRQSETADAWARGGCSARLAITLVMVWVVSAAGAAGREATGESALGESANRVKEEAGLEVLLASILPADTVAGRNAKVAMQLAIDALNGAFAEDRIAGVDPATRVRLAAEFTYGDNDTNPARGICEALYNDKIAFHALVGAPTGSTVRAIATAIGGSYAPLFSTAHHIPHISGPSNIYTLQGGADELFGALRDYILLMKDERDATYEDMISGNGLGIVVGTHPTEHISVLYAADDCNTALLAALGRAVRDSRVDIESEFVFSPNEDSKEQLAHVAQQLRARDARIVVLLAELHQNSTQALLRSASELGLLGSSYQWYVVDDAKDDIRQLSPTAALPNPSFEERNFRASLVGTLSVRPCTSPRDDEALARAYMIAGGTLDASGRVPWRAQLAYDAVLAAGTAVARASTVAGSTLERLPACYSDSLWEHGLTVRDFAIGEQQQQQQPLVSSLHARTGSISFRAESNTRELFNSDSADPPAAYCVGNMQPEVRRGAEFVLVARQTGAEANVNSRNVHSRASMLLRSTRRMNSAQASDSTGHFERDVGGRHVKQVYPALSSAYPTDRASARGRRLRVATQLAEPFVFSENDGRLRGMSIQVMLLLAARMGFEVEFVLIDSPKVNDMLIAVRNGSADLAISWATITAERLKYVSFSVSHYDMGSSFAIRKVEVNKTTMFAFLAPFSTAVWIGIAAMLLVATTLFFLVEGWRNQDFFESSQIRIFGKSFYITFALLLSQLSHQPLTAAGYVLSIGWLIFAFVIGSSYTAELASYLVANRYESQLDAGISALRSGAVRLDQIAVSAGGSNERYVREQVLSCGSNCTSEQLIYKTCNGLHECMHLVTSKQVLAYISDEPEVSYAAQTDYCGLIRVSGESFYAANYGIAMRLGSPLKAEIDRHLLEIRVNGELERIRDIYIPRVGECETVTTLENGAQIGGNADDLQQMSFAAVSGLFLICGVLMLIGIVIYVLRIIGVLEKIKRKVDEWWQRTPFAKANELPEQAEVVSRFNKLQRQREIMEMMEQFTWERSEKNISTGSFEQAAAYASSMKREEGDSSSGHDDGNSVPQQNLSLSSTAAASYGGLNCSSMLPLN